MPRGLCSFVKSEATVLPVVAQTGNDFKQFFERDEPPTVQQFVLIDRLCQFGNIGIVRVVPVRELPTFDAR